MNYCVQVLWLWFQYSQNNYLRHCFCLNEISNQLPLQLRLVRCSNDPKHSEIKTFILLAKTSQINLLSQLANIRLRFTDTSSSCSVYRDIAVDSPPEAMELETIFFLHLVTLQQSQSEMGKLVKAKEKNAPAQLHLNNKQYWDVSAIRFPTHLSFQTTSPSTDSLTFVKLFSAAMLSSLIFSAFAVEKSGKVLVVNPYKLRSTALSRVILVDGSRPPSANLFSAAHSNSLWHFALKTRTQVTD